MFGRSKKKIESKEKSFIENTLELIGMLLLVFIIRTVGFGLYQVPTGSMETTMLVGERFFADKLSYYFRVPVKGEIISFNDPLFKFSTNPLKKLFEGYVYGPANWTKRVIGGPLDIVEGKVVNGKPEVYLNGKKLDESYLNKYPLLYVFKQDPQELSAQIQQEIAGLSGNRYVDQSMINELVMQKLASQTTYRSYDESVSYADQPFYRIEPNRIVRNQKGDNELLRPGTLIRPLIENKTAGNFWNGTDEFYVQLADDEYWCMGDNRLGSKDCRVFGPIKRELIHGRITFRIWSIDSDEAWWIFDLLRHPIDFWSRVRWGRFLQWL